MFVTRRSIRKYKEDSIEKEKLDLILDNALCSPTAQNRRPWEFVVVQDKRMITEISKVRGHKSAFLQGANCLIIVLGDSKVSDVWIEDTSIVAFAIQLAAHEQGVGSCWVQVRLRAHDDMHSAGDYIRKRLSIPENREVECIIGLGYPDEMIAKHVVSKEMRAKVHYEQY